MESRAPIKRETPLVTYIKGTGFQDHGLDPSMIKQMALEILRPTLTSIDIQDFCNAYTTARQDYIEGKASPHRLINFELTGRLHHIKSLEDLLGGATWLDTLESVWYFDKEALQPKLIKIITADHGLCLEAFKFLFLKELLLKIDANRYYFVPNTLEQADRLVAITAEALGYHPKKHAKLDSMSALELYILDGEENQLDAAMQFIKPTVETLTANRFYDCLHYAQEQYIEDPTISGLIKDGLTLQVTALGRANKSKDRFGLFFGQIADTDILTRLYSFLQCREYGNDLKSLKFQLAKQLILGAIDKTKLFECVTDIQAERLIDVTSKTIYTILTKDKRAENRPSANRP